MERQLAAIFSTDVHGYSRLMGEDEEATIHPLKTYRKIITNFIEEHHGRVVDSLGDKRNLYKALHELQWLQAAREGEEVPPTDSS